MPLPDYYYECENTNANHNKFWNVMVNGNEVKTVWGPIGDWKQITPKTFKSDTEAEAELIRLLKQKSTPSHGYTCTNTKTREVFPIGQGKALEKDAKKWITDRKMCLETDSDDVCNHNTYTACLVARAGSLDAFNPATFKGFQHLCARQ